MAPRQWASGCGWSCSNMCSSWPPAGMLGSDDATACTAWLISNPWHVTVQCQRDLDSQASLNDFRGRGTHFNVHSAPVAQCCSSCCRSYDPYLHSNRSYDPWLDLQWVNPRLTRHFKHCADSKRTLLSVYGSLNWRIQILLLMASSASLEAPQFVVQGCNDHLPGGICDICTPLDGPVAGYP